MTFLKYVPEKQESTVYFVWGQVLFSVIHDPFAPSQSLYRETLTAGLVLAVLKTRRTATLCATQLPRGTPCSQTELFSRFRQLVNPPKFTSKILLVNLQVNLLVTKINELLNKTHKHTLPALPTPASRLLHSSRASLHRLARFARPLPSLSPLFLSPSPPTPLSPRPVPLALPPLSYVVNLLHFQIYL